MNKKEKRKQKKLLKKNIKKNNGYDYTISLSKAKELSINNKKYKIPEKYKIQCNLLNLYDYNDFFSFISTETHKFETFMYMTIKDAINKSNSELVCSIFQIKSYDNINNIYYCLKSAVINDEMDKFDNIKFKTIILEYFKQYNMDFQEYIILRDGFYITLKYYYNMLRYLRNDDIILQIINTNYPISK